MFKPKMVGIISCSGEEIPGGAVARSATLKVLQEYLPEMTTTVCLPLFLTGDSQEQGFVKNFPCITVDGCDKRCAARAVEKFGKKPLKEFVIDDFFSKEELIEIAKGENNDKVWREHQYSLRLAEAVAKRAVSVNIAKKLTRNKKKSIN
ncbi:MAG: putative zinc-binding protein [Promethearchaeota archaeon]